MPRHKYQCGDIIQGISGTFYNYKVVANPRDVSWYEVEVLVPPRTLSRPCGKRMHFDRDYVERASRRATQQELFEARLIGYGEPFDEQHPGARSLP